MGAYDSAAYRAALFPGAHADEGREREMNGIEWIATTQLTNLNGDVVADVGETCERVDERSLPLLRDLKWIAPAVVEVEDAPAVEAVDVADEPRKRTRRPRAEE